MRSGECGVRNDRVFQCKVTLRGSKPPIWRRFQVPDDVTLEHFHFALQIVMGWSNSHLHEFMIGDESYGEPHPDYDGEVQDERKITLRRVASSEGARFLYIYDYGDNWQHIVQVEKILRRDPEMRYPVCLAGKRACPPEDCGGIWGYMDLLEIIGNPKHKEYRGMMEWLGGEFDPEKFSLDGVNNRLADFPPEWIVDPDD